MNISIYNFKSISSVVNYDLKPLTILSGINSSGKSSFIQLFLLLKQTLELDSTKHPLYLTGDLYKVQSYKDIVRGKDVTKSIRVAFQIEKSEFQQAANVVESIYDSFEDYTCFCDVSFAWHSQEITVNEFLLKYLIKNGDESTEQSVHFWHTPDGLIPFEIESTNDYFVKRIWESNPTVTSISFNSLFPSAYELEETVEGEELKQGEKIVEKKRYRELPNLDAIKSFLVNFFDQLHYIGPLRIEPQDEYYFSRDHSTVGKSGENVAQVLENFGQETLSVWIPKPAEDDTLTFENRQMRLIDATSFWLCEQFHFGQKISSNKVGENYSIVLTTHSGLDTTIKHVGFGISQVLPIIVEGLLMSKDALLVLEQPEIHLHPKIQSSLFDFLNSLVLSGKKVIVETHSDHFITRMRRRVAEDATNALKDKIKLTFVETEGSNLLFRNIDVDDFGTLEFFPEDFIEKSDAELKAIVKAQMKKRITKQTQ